MIDEMIAKPFFLTDEDDMDAGEPVELDDEVEGEEQADEESEDEAI